MTVDITDFYLNNDLDDEVYMWIPIKDIPEDIQDEYGLQDKIY